MLKQCLILIVSLGLLSLVQSCYYDVEEEIYPTTECETSSVTYAIEILKILKDNCYSCHDAANNFGGITLESYDALKGHIDSGKLLGAIKHEEGYSAMPKNQAQLLECDIAKIEAWITAGAPNN